MRAWLLATLLLSAQGSLACDGLTVTGAWIREAPPGAPVMAGYGTLLNTGAMPLTIIAVESPGFFHHVGMHETSLDEGQARMVPRESLSLAPGQTLPLAPGALHLMLMHPQAGQEPVTGMPVTFRCAGGNPLTVTFSIRAAAP